MERVARIFMHIYFLILLVLVGSVGYGIGWLMCFWLSLPDLVYHGFAASLAIILMVSAGYKFVKNNW